MLILLEWYNDNSSLWCLKVKSRRDPDFISPRNPVKVLVLTCICFIWTKNNQSKGPLSFLWWRLMKFLTKFKNFFRFGIWWNAKFFTKWSVIGVKLVWIRVVMIFCKIFERFLLDYWFVKDYVKDYWSLNFFKKHDFAKALGFYRFGHQRSRKVKSFINHQQDYFFLWLPRNIKIIELALIL